MARKKRSFEALRSGKLMWTLKVLKTVIMMMMVKMKKDKMMKVDR